MTINSTAAILLAFLIAVADKNKIDRKLLRGTIQNDILKEYIARGTFIYPPKSSMKIVTDIFEFCNQELPNWNTISISGYHIREAGSTAIQELAFTFSNAISYIESAIEKGLNIDDFASRMSFFFNSHNHFFEEIAKFRAARKMWATIMKNRFKAKKEKSMICRFHTQTAGSTLAAQEIDNNVVRTTLQATAAVLGGTQSLHTNSRDEALALPNESSALLALRTQQIIAYETGIPDVVDPLAGSYYIEKLTETLEKESFKLIDKIDNLGGAVNAIEQHLQQTQIADSAYEFKKLLI
jgi:methylmalonyl-CoA mutase N-terminal domain